MKEFRYATGEVMRAGDQVVLDGKVFLVVQVFQPMTKEAADYSCFETGGFMLSASDGDCYVLLDPIEDEVEFRSYYNSHKEREN